MFKNAISKILQRPSWLFLLAAILTLVISLLEWNEQVDIHLHDTMYIIPETFLLLPFVPCFALLGLLYQWLHKFLPKKLFTWIHVILTLGALLWGFILFSWHDKFFPAIDTQAEDLTISYIMELYAERMYIYAAITYLLILAQVVFICHFVYGLISYYRKKSPTLS